MKKYDVAAYVWPAYTGDEKRTAMFWPDGIGEWQSVISADSKFDGHNWPRKPLWGYVNEADPYVMEMQIEAAVDHGVNVFIYDWYWYDNRPFLENCLNEGFLKAKNNDKMKFYIMWANHDANYVWDKRLSDEQKNTVVWKGTVTREEFEIVGNRMIEKYFSHPSYYTIENKPVFIIGDIQNLIDSFGDVQKTKEALDWFEQQAIKSGFKGIHFQLISVGNMNYNLSGVDSNAIATTSEVIEILGFKSISNYQYCHFVDIDRDYNEIMVDVQKEWERLDKNNTIPYFPHISLGWDNNPRFKKFRPCIMKNNTPENIENALKLAKKYVDDHPEQTPLITINSWNEWTESSYLQPDNLYGYGYLEAVKSVFK